MTGLTLATPRVERPRLAKVLQCCIFSEANNKICLDQPALFITAYLCTNLFIAIHNRKLVEPELSKASASLLVIVASTTERWKPRDLARILQSNLFTLVSTAEKAVHEKKQQRALN